VLQQRVRNNDVVARLGGDEFAVLLHNCAPADATQIAADLLKTVDEFEFIWGTNKFTLGVSIGLVAIDSHFKRITQVMNAADSACYAAKDAGRNRVSTYQEESQLLERRHGEMEWVARAKRALVENRLFLEAQEIRPLVQPDPAAIAALRAAAAHARRVGAGGPTRRFSARRRTLQPVSPLRPLGHRDGAAVGRPA
jgi:predicted signal transduction protein with EAL and GGDEF domain